MQQHLNKDLTAAVIGDDLILAQIMEVDEVELATKLAALTKVVIQDLGAIIIYAGFNALGALVVLISNAFGPCALASAIQTAA